MTDQEALDAAKEAYHQLMTGRKSVRVTFPSGQTVQYQDVDAASLRAYIDELERKIEAGGAVTRSRYTPTRFYF